MPLQCWLLLLPCLTAAETVAELPRRQIASLRTADFDKLFLGDRPVILAGASLCPPGVGLADLGEHCTGRVAYSKQSNSTWAGLKQVKRRMTIGEFVAEMGSDRASPRYMFGVHAFEHCPGLLRSVELPAPLVGAFAMQWESGGACNFPLELYNLYIAEKGFASSLHVDQGHAAFVASMCEGRKHWRVLRNRDYLAHVEELGRSFAQEGVKLKDSLVFADLPRPFPAFDGSALAASNVTVYEGELGPGEILVIPSGAPHAARTMDDSFMVAMNDVTPRGLQQIVAACGAAVGCPEEGLGGNSAAIVEKLLRMGAAVAESKKQRRGPKRKSMPLMEAYGCGGPEYCQKLRERAQSLGVRADFECGSSTARSEL